MSQSTTMIYGAYSFEPVPFINIQKSFNKSGAGVNQGVTLTMRISGTLTAMDDNLGFKTLMGKKDALKEAFKQDGGLLQIKCGEDVVLETYPRILDVSCAESPNNWVFTIPFTITLEYEEEPVNQGISGYGENNPGLHPPYIQSFTEDWSLEFVPDQSNPYDLTPEVPNDKNPYAVRFTHNLNAVGKTIYSGVGGSNQLTGDLVKPAWQQARDYAQGFLGFDLNLFKSDVGINLTGDDWSPYDHYRVQSVDKTAGSFSVQENWLVLGDRGGLARKAIEDFTINITEAGQEADFDIIAIQGSIQGLEERNYNSPDGPFEVTGYKYDNALSYYNSIKGSMLYNRVNDSALYNGFINPIAVVKTEGYSPNQGIVTYGYTFNNRPSNCITGSRFENITISNSNPTDVFALIPIPGRPQGPILQCMNTVTEYQQTVNVDVLMSGNNDGCTVANLISGSNPRLNVETEILCPFEQDLKNKFQKVKKSADTENWIPRVGRYNRSVTWTAVPCDTIPATSFCPEE